MGLPLCFAFDQCFAEVTTQLAISAVGCVRVGDAAAGTFSAEEGAHICFCHYVRYMSELGGKGIWSQVESFNVM